MVAPSTAMVETGKFLQNVPLFKDLPPAELGRMANAMESKTFAPGTVIFRQGEVGDQFFVIHSGEADVKVHPSIFMKVGDKIRSVRDLHFGGKKVPKGSTGIIDKFDPSREFPFTIRVDTSGQRGRVLQEEVELCDGPPKDQYVATLRAGDYFGEQSILKAAPRAATVVVTQEMVALSITREKFKQFQLDDKLQFVKRKAVVAPFDADFDQTKDQKTTKTADESKLIKRAIRANKNITQLVDIDDEQLETLADYATKLSAPKDSVLIRQGDLFAQEFYIVHTGEVSFHVKEGKAGKDELAAELMNVGTTGAGGSFGELALLYHAPRAATVTTTQDSTLWVIDRSTFKHVLMAANDHKRQAYAKALERVEILQCLLSDERDQLAEALVEQVCIRGEEVIKQGAKGDTFYILFDGSVDVVKDGKKISDLKASREQGRSYFFGEKSLIADQPRDASVIVSSENATLLCLARPEFTRLLGPLQDIMKEHASLNTGEKRKTKGVVTGFAPTNAMRKDIRREDLKRLGLLGCGGFGAVSLEQHKQTGETFALKALSKGFIVKMRMQKGVIREKEILAMCGSDFIVKLFATFKTHDTLFFLLEPALGGELFATYHKHRFHGSVSKAKFFSASVIKAFEHLHERNVLYRDLKPENLLLDVKGFCKVTDMGLAKVVTGKTYTTCGTPDYFAPEVIQQTGMGKGVDWWTLGILVHELLSGHAPFEASDPMETYQKIVRGIAKVSFSYKNRDPDAVEIVVGLLKHNASERLPMRSGGMKNLMDARWYRSFNWSALVDRTMQPPYVPNVKSATDISNFRAHEADLPPTVPYKDPGTGWDDTF